MNKIKKSVGIITLLTMMMACNDGDFVEPAGEALQLGSVVINQTEYQTVQGQVKETLTLSAETPWLLTGGLFVSDGATLEIEAGATVYADNGTSAPLISIKQGGQIVANGTSTNPIVFTTINSLEGNANPGDWGGIIINGNAPTNLGYFGESEGGSGFYGGSEDSDNSGVLRYVRIEYAGKVFGEDNELNGLSLNAVGSGTTLEYIQTYRCADDGFEFFGGTANLRYAVSTGNGDDSFDWTFGWQGRGQFWIVDQDEDGDNGLEADNNENDFGALRFSAPQVSNLTFFSRGGDAGVLLRNGTRGQLFNGLVTGFTEVGLVVDPDEVLANHLSDESLAASFFSSFGNEEDYDVPESATGFQENAQTAVPFTNTFVGTEGSAFDPANLDAWFVSAPYKGAIVDDPSDWTKGWVKNLDGTIR